MKRPAIILVGYNRPASLKRLLHSIEKASYSGYTDIPLIISIDGGGDQEVLNLAESFAWKNGTKKIIIHPQNLGLRKHILFCGDLALEYGSVIILEDDCLISKNFYTYSSQSLSFYHNDEKVAGIGLYAYQYNEMASLPFTPMIDGNDVYFMQHPCSWGQAWTARQWQAFKTFYNTDPQIDANTNIPESIKNWPESSWKKYFAMYMAEHDKYFVYPMVSYSSNFADLGENWKSSIPFFQVALEHQEKFELNLIPFKQSQNKYDAYFEILAESIIGFGADIKPDTCIDLYGTKQKERIHNKYLLSSKPCRSPIKSFGAEMQSLLQNIVHENPGSLFSYALRENFDEEVLPSVRNLIWEKQQAQGYYFASKTKYYKLGFYMLHPLRFIKKRIKRYR